MYLFFVLFLRFRCYHCPGVLNIKPFVQGFVRFVKRANRNTDVMYVSCLSLERLHSWSKFKQTIWFLKLIKECLHLNN